jgi:hypothetical protein
MQILNQYHPFGTIIIRASQPDAVSGGVRKMKGFKVFSSSNQIMQDMVAVVVFCFLSIPRADRAGPITASHICQVENDEYEVMSRQCNARD